MWSVLISNQRIIHLMCVQLVEQTHFRCVYIDKTRARLMLTVSSKNSVCFVEAVECIFWKCEITRTNADGSTVKIETKRKKESLFPTVFFFTKFQNISLSRVNYLYIVLRFDWNVALFTHLVVYYQSDGIFFLLGVDNFKCIVSWAFLLLLLFWQSQ